MLVNLEWLNLGHNLISTLPNGLSRMGKLEDIGLAHNKLDKICWFHVMKSLKSLIIYDNKISYMEGQVLATLQNLQVLEASMNDPNLGIVQITKNQLSKKQN